MIKWEYNVLHGTPFESDDFLTSMDATGNDGWELVQIVGDRAIFKRPIKPARRKKKRVKS